MHPDSTATNLAAAQEKPVNEKTLGLLQKHAAKVAGFLQGRPERKEALWRVAQMLDKLPWDWRQATKVAGLNQKRQMASLLEQFPERFEIRGPDVRLR